jgi:hypothetical protein
MHKVKEPDPRFRGIPWAKRTIVTDGYKDPQSGYRDIELQTENPWMSAQVDYHGGIDLEIDSEDIIGDYLKRSPALTRSIRKYLDISGARYFHDHVEDWVKGIVPEPSDELVREGVLDWEPPKKPPVWKKLGKMAYHGKGKSTEISDSWVGSTFPYAHVIFTEIEGWPEDGLVVNFGDKPEVWLGDVDAFLAANEENFESPEAYLDYNAHFENGFIWALNEMGAFDEGGSIPDWVIDVLSVDPDLMTPEIVEKLLPQYDILESNLQTAIQKWLDHREAEREQATGQLRFWPRREDA